MDFFLTNKTLWNDFPRDLQKADEDFLYLKNKAEFLLARRGSAVTDKVEAGPSGDFHDYVSQAPYWWPDPAKTDGLPYICCDGKLNPQIGYSDRSRIEELRDGISCLVLRSQIEGGAPYADQAGKYLRRWFLEPETRMNPNLQYGQFIPGVCEGRGIGIIDTAMFCFLLDEVTHLPFGPFWTKHDLEALKSWFGCYLEWLLESGHGRKEGTEHNNHGTWYDAQVVCFALFCGRPEVALRQVEQCTRGRLRSQMLPDGSQPHELARTLSMSYCTFNLIAFSLLAQGACQMGINLWKEEPALLSGIRWMLPFYSGARSWTWTQHKTFNRSAARLLINLAGQGSGEGDLRQAAEIVAGHSWNKFSSWGIEINQIKNISFLSGEARSESSGGPS